VCANNDENLCEKMSLWLKRNGFTAMMLKQKLLLTMGLENIYQIRKTRASSVTGEGDDCFFLFVLFMEVLYTMNFHLVAIMSTNSTTFKGEAVKGKRPNSRREKNGCSTIKTLPHIHSLELLTTCS